MALTDGLISYWKLDESSGSVLDAHDSNNGTNNGATPNVTGKINTAYDFEHSEGDYILIPDADNLHITPNISISLWAKFESLGETYHPQRLLEKLGCWAIINRNAEMLWQIGGNTYVRPDVIEVGVWYHLVFTYDGDTMIIYVNGSADGDANGNTLPSNTNDIYIGKYPGGAGYSYDGLLDEIGIWDRALTQAEVDFLYQGGSGFAYPFSGGPSVSKSDSVSFSEVAYVQIQGSSASGLADRDCFFINNGGAWVQFQDFEYFDVKKTMNGVSEFEVKLYDIQDAQKVYFKEKAEILFFVGTTKILKGRIQSIDYASAYECIAKGFGMETKLLDKDLIKSGDKRVEYDNISAQTIAKEILSVNTNGSAPWIINPGTDGLFLTDFGQTTLRFEYANRLNSIGALCNAIDYEWECYQDATYANDYIRIKSLLGNQTSVKTFNISGDSANCTKTERNIDINNMVNYLSCLGYGDGINQIQTSTYSASTIYSVLSADITATSTSIVLADASSFPSSGEIRIMEERITYTGKSSNTLTGCTRGANSTTAKSHKINCYVEIYYASSSPQASSSISTYGIMEYTLINRDIMDVDTLEVIASGYLLDRMTPIISIKIQSSEPMTDITAVTMGDIITINDAETGMNALEVRVVGLEYKDNYGELSMEISASNRSLEFIEQMNKAREDQQNMQKYMQGSTNLYALMETTEGDATHYIDNRFYMPADVVALNKVLLNFKMKAVKQFKSFGQYQKTTFHYADVPDSWTTLATLTVNNVAANDLVIIEADGVGDWSTSGYEGMYVALRRDSTYITSQSYNVATDPDDGFRIPFVRFMCDQPGAGNHTYDVRANSVNGDENAYWGNFSVTVYHTDFQEGSLTSPSVALWIGEDGGTMTKVADYVTDQNDLDITNAVQAIGTNKWIDIQFRPNQEIRIEMNAYVKMFLESI